MRFVAIMLSALSLLPLSTFAEEVRATNSTLAVQTPADYILLAVIARHDQSRTFEEFVERLDDKQSLTQYPPPGIEVESRYAMMGFGDVITLRVPPARLRKVNLPIEKTAWGVFRAEFYATYDYCEPARRWRRQALQRR